MSSVIGKIHSLACENFVTHTSMKCFPGKHLNLILGPNGTGKSSLVAAVVLGLGGEPKLLSRATDIREYIQNGKQSAWIEIEIYIGTRTKTGVLRRSFDLSGKSVYKIDGKIVTLSQYLSHVAKYNIQISNLCQFMPQDRVQDFAKMNPQELLNSTQAAICTPQMIDNFEKLKELRNIQKNGDQSLDGNQKRLKELEERNAQLQTVIDKIRIRDKFLEDIEIGEVKRLWLELDVVEEDLKQMREILKKAQFDFNRDEKIYKEVQMRSKDIIAKREELSKVINGESIQVTQFSATLDNFEESLGKYEQALSDADNKLKSKKTDLIDREADIVQATRLFECYTQELKEAMTACGKNYNQELAGYKTNIESKRKEIAELSERRSDLNHQIDHYQPELTAFRNRISKIQNEGERRLNKLREIDMNAYRGVEWLRKNRHLFEGHVYEPMLLEISVKNANNAKYFENTVAKRDLLAFVCTEKSDVSLLIQKLCNEQQLRINVLHSDATDRCHYRPETPLSELKRYGFYSYLLDMVGGPAPILNYLCKAYKIHNILIGTDEVEEHVENLPPHIRLFYSSQNRFSVVISRYTREASSSCSGINQMNLIIADVDERQLGELKNKLMEITQRTDEYKNLRNSLESKINECNESVNEMMKMRSNLEGKLERVREKKARCKRQEEKINELKNSEIDIVEEENKFKAFCKQTLSKMLEVHQCKIRCFADYQNTLQNHEYTKAKLHVFRKETIDIENQLKSTEDDYKAAKKRFDGQQKTEIEIKKKRDDKEAHARAKTNGRHRNDPKFKYRQQFSELPDSLEELDDRLIELRTRADCMTEYQVDISTYEQQQVEMESLRTAIKKALERQDDLSSQIQTIHNDWYPYFSEKKTVINECFSRFMAHLDYAGEVNIINNGENEYDSYGIQILVQYRNNAKLQPLDRFIQSGGERAVAIALYSMSLQNLTTVPFRCVDEINQGMDPKNERKVFNLIVDETCKTDGSQYFFVTPKLLPNLKFNKRVTALIVFNGALANPNVFNNFRSKMNTCM